MDISSLLSGPRDAATSQEESVMPLANAYSQQHENGQSSHLGQKQHAVPYASDRSRPSHSSTSPKASGGPSSHGKTQLARRASAQPSSEQNSPPSDGRGEAASQRPQVRHSSISMETLADLATMQHYSQSSRNGIDSATNGQLKSPQNSPLLTNFRREMSNGVHDTSSPNTPLVGPPRRNSGPTDHPMSDAPTAVVPPQVFETEALEQDELQTISKLTQTLAENTMLYDSHVHLVNLLQQGFWQYIFSQESGDGFPDPQSYNLLAELRQARTAMQTRFTVGEQMWIDWLKSECILAGTLEEKAAVVELCSRAVEEEVGSVKLWRFYVDWLWHMFKKSHNTTTSYRTTYMEEDSELGGFLSSQTWSSEDRQIAEEVFGWSKLMQVWDNAVSATEWHIDESHVLWDARMEVIMSDLESQPTADKVEYVKHLYHNRLRQPHAMWDNTFQNFSQFVGEYEKDRGPRHYEDLLAKTAEQTQRAKTEYSLRAENEFRLTRAKESGDASSEFEVMKEYLERERQHSTRKNSPQYGTNLLFALFERANLRLPSSPEIWEDYLDVLVENKFNNNTVVEVAYRATRHCPWSGALWAKELYAVEAANRPHAEIEDVKHHATSTGLVEEIGGMDELIQVYVAWCGFLRRQAFASGSTDDRRDIAEMGILSAIETVSQHGTRRYGAGFKGDPLFRLERIFTKFLAQKNDLEEARKIWQKLSVTHGDTYEFWDRYYLWEMTTWGKQFGHSAAKGGPLPVPSHATDVLRSAIRRPNLDWPEKVIEAYIHHCTQHETVSKIQEAQVEVRRAGSKLAKRRAKEAVAYQAQARYEAQQAVNSVETADSASVDDNLAQRKRKRDDQTEEATQPKAARLGLSTEPENSESKQSKRDREHNTIFVRHLPVGCDEVAVRKVFSEYGTILSIDIVPVNDQESNATIEFASPEDVDVAQAKKMFNGHEIDVEIGTGTTLFMTNYPLHADAKWVREFLEPYGTVVSVRFPSLKYNSKRRFCYVQMLTASQAQAATVLDEKSVEGNFTVTVKLSNPAAKKQRANAMEQGRELYVGNLDWSANEGDVKALFQQYGTVESVRIPRPQGKSIGTAFVVFAEKHQAEDACAMNGHPYKSRVLRVSISKSNAKPQPSGVVKATPDTERSRSARNSSTPQSLDLVEERPVSNRETQNRDRHERSVALLNVPQTVNEVRIRSLMERFGDITKIKLRPDHGGALIEFTSVHGVGKAQMTTEELLLDNHPLKIGTFEELMQGKPMKAKVNGTEEKKTKPNVDNMAAKFQRAVAPARPGVGGQRRGGRGGLGFRKGFSKPSEDGNNSSVATNTVPSDCVPAKGKNQDDFRAMLEKK